MTNALTRQILRTNQAARWLPVLLLFLWIVTAGRAAEYNVANVSELSTRMSAIQPGDTVIMADGVWADADVLLRASGTATQPITVKARTPGKVLLSGSSRLRMAGNWLVVDGLVFTNGYRTSGDVISFRYTTSQVTEPANNSILTNCAVIDYNTPSTTNDTKWVSIYGVSNRVVNCYFKGKSNLGSTIVVWVDPEPNYHRIERNYFGFRPVLGVNGGETIRVGTSDTSTNSSRTLVAFNYFERCNGDAEAVSNKSCDNEYRHNTFVECEGALSLRHGNNCVVEGNYFFGNLKPRTGGVRIIGEDHKVYNNYFSELAGSAAYSPLSIMLGLENSPLNGYFQVKRAQVLFNTFVRCSNSIVIGLSGTLSGSTEVTTLPPVDCTIANNVVLSTGSKIIDKRIEPVNMLWQGNVMFGGNLAGFTNGILQLDPELSPAGDGLWRPSGSSPVRGAAVGTYSFVDTDFEGQTRASPKDAGCDQASPSPVLYPPLTTLGVGPAWLPTRQTLITWPTPNDLPYGTPLGPQQLNATANIPGTFLYNPPAGTILPRGANNILSVVFTPEDTGNYSSATQAVLINVVQGIPSITWTNPADISFGTALGSAQLNATANVPGTFSYSPGSGTILEPGNGHVLKVTFQPNDTANYGAVTQSVSINVRRAYPSVTWLTPGDIALGTALSGTQLNATANKPGTFLYVPPAGTVLGPGFEQVLSVIFTPDDAVHYSSVTQTTAINVIAPVKLDPVVTWNNPAPIAYGTALGAGQLNASASVAGTFLYTPPAGTVLNAGTGYVLNVVFTPKDTTNYNSASRTVTLNVNKANPVITWPQPEAVAVGTVLSSVHLNASANVAGSFTYTPPAGTVLSTPGTQALSVVFSPTAFTNYNTRTQTVALEVATRVGSAMVRVAYLVPTNRVAQSGAVTNLKEALILYREWFRDQMQRNGFGPKTLNIEMEADGITPIVHVVKLPQTDAELLSVSDGTRILQAATNAGLTIGARGQIWWLIPETHVQTTDGTILGSFERAYSFGGSGEDPGWGMMGSDSLAFLRTPWLTNNLAYNGLTVPELGSKAMKQEITFPWYEGSTLSSVSSYSFGLGMCAILNGFGVEHDYRNDQNFNGNVMGFGFSGFRGNVYPKYYPYNYTRLSYGMALALSVSPYFNPGKAITDEVKPSVTITTSGPRTPQGGVLRIAFNGTDAGGLHGALLYWKQGKEWELIEEAVLSGTTTSYTFSTAYYDPGQTNTFRIDVYDRAGNKGTASTLIVPAANLNNSPLPFITVTPANAGLGEEVVFDASASFDAEHSASLLEVEWDLDGDGNFDTPPSVTKTHTNRYFNLGPHMVRARLSDPAGADSVSAPVPVNITLCSTILSPTGRSHGFGMVTGNVTVSSSPKCTWMVITTNDWVTIITGTNYMGTNKVQYVLQPNPTFSPRTATLQIGDQLYTIQQDGIVCTYSLSPLNRFHGFGATTNNFKVTTKAECLWEIVNTNSWITPLTPLQGTGTVTFQYALPANRVPQKRVGNITIGDLVYTVTQWGTNCEFVLSAPSAAHSSEAEAGEVTLSTAGNCTWTVANTNSWITINSGTFSGSTTLSYTVAANNGPLRSGTLTMGDQTFTVLQAGCSYEVQPLGRVHSDSAGNGTITVSAGSACPWNVSTPNSWIHIQSGPGAVGNGMVNYTVDANPGNLARNGQIIVAGKTFTLTQEGIPCTNSLSTYSVIHGEAVEVGEIVVTAGAQCSWTVANTNDWIKILFTTNGMGSGSVIYTVDANEGLSRTGFVRIAGLGCRIVQERGLRTMRASDLVTLSAQTNWLKLVYEAQGTGNSIEGSLCFDSGLLSYVGARMNSNIVGGILNINSSKAGQGQLGYALSLPSGWSFTASTQAVIEVGFRAAMISGVATTTVAFCDSPIARAVLDVVGQPVLVQYRDPKVTIIGDCTLGESLDAPQFVWTTNGAWFCQTNVTHDGQEAAQSGPTADSATTSFQTTMTGPGTLTFWWKVSSETNNDTMRFYVGGTEQTRISGETGWQLVTFNLPSGSQTVQWRYQKNGSVSAGQDRGWVDQVQFVPAAPAITSHPVGTAVDQGATVTLTVGVTGTPPLTYEWLYNGSPVSNGGNVSGATTGSLRITNIQPAQAGIYSVVVNNASGTAASSNAIVNVGMIVPLGEALDQPTWTWTQDGFAPWVGQTALSHDGNSAARSGLIPDGESASFFVNLTGAGTLSFWWKVSSQTNSDRLRLYMDGDELLRISGEVDWQFQSIPIPSGIHELEWRYSKNSSVTAGQDRGWVDQVQFLPIAPSITTHPVSQALDQGATAVLSVVASGTTPLSYRWKFNDNDMADGSGISGTATPTLRITNVQPWHAGQYSVSVGNASGTAVSTNATITVSPVIPLAEAVDAPQLNWTVSGTPPFVGQSAVTHDGVDAARSGAISHSGTTSFRTTVTGPGTVSFWWKVSSESGNDRLRFYLDGSQQENISGEVDWTWRTYTVGSGTQDLEWRYTKNSSVTVGQDRGWVDQIIFISNSVPTAPIIAIHPVDQFVVSPGTISFRAGAVGSTPLTYQWQFNGTNLVNGGSVSGSTTTNLTLSSVQAAQAGAYSIIVSNAAGIAVSSNANLTVVSSPVITNQPATQNVIAGTTVTFRVGAIGTATLGYQWRLNGTNVVNGGKYSGATTATLSISSVTAAQEGVYSVVVSNGFGVVASTDASLAVNTPPSISTQPLGRTLVAGTNLNLSVAAAGSAPLTYRWRLNGTNLFESEAVVGTATPFLMLSNIQPSQAGVYSVLVSNLVGSVISSNASVIVVTPPAITSQPVDQNVNETATVSFSAAATGSTPLSYQWRRDGTNLVDGGPISGATSPLLTIVGAVPAHSGNYSLRVTNVAGVAISSNAVLKVTPALTLQDVLDGSTLTWSSGGNALWTAHTNLSHDTFDSARSGTISANQSTWLETTVAGPGILRFWWKVSSETNKDVLTFTQDNGELARISGEVDWRLYVLEVPSGTHVFRWTYSKDASGSSGQDRAWVDEVEFTPSFGPSLPAITLQPLSQQVDPGVTVNFSGAASGAGPLTYQWHFNGGILNDGLDVSGAREPTLTVRNVNTSRAGFYTLVVRNEYGWAFSSNVVLTLTPKILLPEALDTPGRVWVTDGFSPWAGQNLETYDWLDAAASGPLLNNTTNYVETVVLGPAAVSFWWKVSSETNRDRLRFTINGVEQANISGEVGWRWRTFDLTNLTQVIRWSYTKDASGSAGQDRGWLDQVVVGPAAPVITRQPVNTTADLGALAYFSVGDIGTSPINYQWFHNSIGIGDGSNVVGTTLGRLMLSNAQPSQAGAYSVLVMNGGGRVMSTNAYLGVYPNYPMATALDTATNGWNSGWITGGEAPWVTTTSVTHDGVDAMASGNMLDGQRDFIETTVVGPGKVSFWWKVSSQTNAPGPTASGDKYRFFIGGIEQASISGNVDWQFKVYDVSNGVQVLHWRYQKDGSLAAGSDKAWLDQVQFAPVLAPTILTHPTGTNVDPGTTVSFNVAADGSSPFTYQWRRNGINLANNGNVSGATSTTLKISNVQGTNGGTYSVVVSNSAGIAISSNAVLQVTPSLPFGQVLDAPELVWSTSGSPSWLGQTQVAHNGTGSARSGAIGDGTSTALQTTVNGPGRVSFWWKVSSETNKDLLIFYIGSSEKARISGEVNWTQVSMDVPSGNNQILQWKYQKNGSVSVGTDRGWVDEVQFLPTAPTFGSHPTNQTVDAETTINLVASVSGTPPLTYRWLFNGNPISDGGNVSGATSSTLTLDKVQPGQSGNYSLQVMNSVGTVTSSNALITVIPIFSLEEAMDVPGLIWTTSGKPAWVGQPLVTSDGTDAARSGAIVDSGSCTMQTTVRGPGTVTFWWKVSSETNNDTLRFLVAGSEVARISGEMDWHPRTFNVTRSGDTTLAWTYKKNGSVSRGQDKAWVDQLQFTATSIPGSSTEDPSDPGNGTGTATSPIAAKISFSGKLVSISWDANPQKTYQVFFKDNVSDPEWQLVDGEVRIQWKMTSEGEVDQTSVTATVDDVLGNQSRYYRILEY